MSSCGGTESISHRSLYDKQLLLLMWQRSSLNGLIYIPFVG